ncbi:MAG: PEGA domain-containing protein [Betaproteobacteria bacterium]|nr:PEGA domain-containing protein [Betaproteobacteria bacterium]
MKADAAKPSAPAAPAVPPATLVFSIQPWGEVFLNGKPGGVSPPVKSLKLAPGKYKVEVRNTTFAAHVENIEVKSRDEVTIRHRFQ